MKRVIVSKVDGPAWNSLAHFECNLCEFLSNFFYWKAHLHSCSQTIHFWANILSSSSNHSFSNARWLLHRIKRNMTLSRTEQIGQNHTNTRLLVRRNFLLSRISKHISTLNPVLLFPSFHHLEKLKACGWLRNSISRIGCSSCSWTLECWVRKTAHIHTHT